MTDNQISEPAFNAIVAAVQRAFTKLECERLTTKAIHNLAQDAVDRLYPDARVTGVTTKDGHNYVAHVTLPVKHIEVKFRNVRSRAS